MATEVLSPFKVQMALYWDPDCEHSFCNLHNRVMACAKQMDDLRETAIAELSNAFKVPENLSVALDQKQALLQKGVEEIREIEKALDPALTLEAGSSEMQDPAALGDYEAFKRRARQLDTNLRKVYKDSLYPFLQVLQNAKSGWNPAGIVCKMCDYWWPARDPVQEIEKMFPKTEEIPAS